MPEYGRATGGILNVVTKTGSNEFHGGVFGYYTPGALEGTRKRGPSATGRPSQTQQLARYIGDIGVDIGGPIVKDKLWFYAGFDFAQTRFGLDRSLERASSTPRSDPARRRGRTTASRSDRAASPDTQPAATYADERRRSRRSAS